MQTLSVIAIVAAFMLAASPFAVAQALQIPNTMRAAAFDHGGGPEVLSIHQLPVPSPKADEVLIAVHATGVAAWEAGFRQHPAESTRFPVILGGDGAGTIAAVGADVHGFKVGEKVYGTGGRFYAEYTTARAENVVPIPRGLDFTAAGILAISGLSATQGLDDALQLKTGETVIIHGAAGAVGTLAVQFAKLRGAKVLATATSDDGLALVSRLGADAVVNGRTGDIGAVAKRFAPQGVDAVLGLAGGDALERCIDALRHDGRGRVAYLYGVEPIPKPRFGISMILYSFTSNRPELERLNKTVEAARAQVPVAAQYPLDAAAAAHERLEAGHVLGKIAIVAQ
jgi:NADPH:quinone reductase-like Zn-dependent oxidoreductase